MFIKERCEVAGRGEMGLGTNLGFPYLELSLLHNLQSVAAFCPASCNMHHAS